MMARGEDWRTACWLFTELKHQHSASRAQGRIQRRLGRRTFGARNFAPRRHSAPSFITPEGAIGEYLAWFFLTFWTGCVLFSNFTNIVKRCVDVQARELIVAELPSCRESARLLYSSRFIVRASDGSPSAYGVMGDHSGSRPQGVHEGQLYQSPTIIVRGNTPNGFVCFHLSFYIKISISINFLEIYNCVCSPLFLKDGMFVPTVKRISDFIGSRLNVEFLCRDERNVLDSELGKIQSFPWISFHRSFLSSLQWYRDNNGR